MNFVGLVRMTLGLVNASHSLLEGQAVKLTFFASCGTQPYTTFIMADHSGGVGTNHIRARKERPLYLSLRAACGKTCKFLPNLFGLLNCSCFFGVKK